MDLIDRYVHEVGERLPRRMRADVEAELRSLLGESLEEKAREAGGGPTPAIAERVLREFGPPREVAERYAPPARYLIGPRLFPAYRIAVAVMAGIFGAALLVLALLALTAAGGGRFTFADLGSVLQGAVFNFGLLTLVFAAVERVLRDRDAAGPAREWDPSALPPVRDPDRISPVALVFSTYAIVGCAVLFNFFPRWVGIHTFSNGEWRSLSVLLPEFSRHLPALNAWWGLAFLLDLLVLRRGRWSRRLRWAELLLGVLGAGILAVIVAGPPVFRFDSVVKNVLAVCLLIALIESGVRLFRLVRGRPSDPPKIR